ncbi:MAG: hypothetical protein CMM24_00340 [Rhodospirillaceae bacterium]|nr:hypothetical protein [Rhodospirillaceae bacterium]|tara:strand:+ start:1569 stop:2345 length:777 start_codon:yes stop_codon:yes gene_type:complete
MQRPIVIQSFHARPWPKVIEMAIESVASWAKKRDYRYMLFGDEVMDLLPDGFAIKCSNRIPMMIDLARLLTIRQLFEEGAEQVIWFDADMLIFSTEHFDVDLTSEQAVGREIWVSKTKAGRWKAHRHVHNAVLSFRRTSPILDFLIFATERIAGQLKAPASPQLVGPKLFSHIHNLVNLTVWEEAGVLSPEVMSNVIDKGGPALNCHLREQTRPALAANLCYSLVNKKVDDVFVDEGFLLDAANQLLRQFSKSGLTRI